MYHCILKHTLQRQSIFGNVDKDQAKVDNKQNEGRPSVTRRELHSQMKQLQRDKKFSFKPQLTPLTERLALTARVNRQSLSKSGRQSINLPTSRGQSPRLEDTSTTSAVKRKRWEDLYADDKVKREKIQQQSSQLKDKRYSMEVEGCTFKPNLHMHMSKTSDKMAKQNGTRETTPQRSPIKSFRNSSIYERNAKWKEEKEMKVKVKQNENQQNEVKDATFKPVIHQFDKSKVATKQELECNMKAVDQYMQRMKKAKVEEQRRQSILNTGQVYTGKPSTNKSYMNKPLTQAKSPRLSLSRSQSSLNVSRSKNVTPQKLPVNQHKVQQKSPITASITIKDPQFKQSENDISLAQQVKFQQALQSLHSQILSLQV